MKYDQFLREVQHRAGLGSEADTVKAIRATLETLAERLKGGEPSNLASQLPEEIQYYIRTLGTGAGKPLSANEFVKKVAQRENVDEASAREHVRAVMSVLRDAVTPGEWRDVMGQLPSTYTKLFELGAYAGAGAAGAGPANLEQPQDQWQQNWQSESWQPSSGGELF